MVISHKHDTRRVWVEFYTAFVNKKVPTTTYNCHVNTNGVASGLVWP